MIKTMLMSMCTPAQVIEQRSKTIMFAFAPECRPAHAGEPGRFGDPAVALPQRLADRLFFLLRAAYRLGGGGGGIHFRLAKFRWQFHQAQGRAASNRECIFDDIL